MSICTLASKFISDIIDGNFGLYNLSDRDIAMYKEMSAVLSKELMHSILLLNNGYSLDKLPDGSPNSFYFQFYDLYLNRAAAIIETASFLVRNSHIFNTFGLDASGNKCEAFKNGVLNVNKPTIYDYDVLQKTTDLLGLEFNYDARISRSFMTTSKTYNVKDTRGIWQVAAASIILYHLYNPNSLIRKLVLDIIKAEYPDLLNGVQENTEPQKLVSRLLLYKESKFLLSRLGKLCALTAFDGLLTDENIFKLTFSKHHKTGLQTFRKGFINDIRSIVNDINNIISTGDISTIKLIIANIEGYQDYDGQKLSTVELATALEEDPFVAKAIRIFADEAGGFSLSGSAALAYNGKIYRPHNSFHDVDFNTRAINKDLLITQLKERVNIAESTLGISKLRMGAQTFELLSPIKKLRISLSIIRELYPTYNSLTLFAEEHNNKGTPNLSKGQTVTYVMADVPFFRLIESKPNGEQPVYVYYDLFGNRIGTSQGQNTIGQIKMVDFFIRKMPVKVNKLKLNDGTIISISGDDISLYNKLMMSRGKDINDFLNYVSVDADNDVYNVASKNRTIPHSLRGLTPKTYSHTELLRDRMQANGINVKMIPKGQLAMDPKVLNEVRQIIHDAGDNLGLAPKGLVSNLVGLNVLDEFDLLGVPGNPDKNYGKYFLWAIVRTKAFKEWFGDWENGSKNELQVVDENGEPRLLYHGLHTLGHIPILRPGAYYTKNVNTFTTTNFDVALGRAFDLFTTLELEELRQAYETSHWKEFFEHKENNINDLIQSLSLLKTSEGSLEKIKDLFINIIDEIDPLILNKFNKNARKNKESTRLTKLQKLYDRIIAEKDINEIQYLLDEFVSALKEKKYSLKQSRRLGPVNLFKQNDITLDLNAFKQRAINYLSGKGLRYRTGISMNGVMSVFASGRPGSSLIIDAEGAEYDLIKVTDQLKQAFPELLSTSTVSTDVLDRLLNTSSRYNSIIIRNIYDGGEIPSDVVIAKAESYKTPFGYGSFDPKSNKVEFYIDSTGLILGFADRNEITLYENADESTYIHEYTHLWAKSMMVYNPTGWNNVKKLLRDTNLWNEVVNDLNYSDIIHSDDAIASEVLARLSGKEGAALLRQQPAQDANKLLAALKRFWNWITKSIFDTDFNVESIHDLPKIIINDLLNGVDLRLHELENITSLTLDSNITTDTIVNKIYEGLKSNTLQNKDQIEKYKGIQNLQLTKEKIQEYCDTLGADKVWGWYQSITENFKHNTIDDICKLKHKLEYEIYSQHKEFQYKEQGNSWSGDVNDLTSAFDVYVYLDSELDILGTGKNNAVNIDSSLPLYIIEGQQELNGEVLSNLVSLQDGAELLLDLYTIAKDNPDISYYVDMELFLLKGVDLNKLITMFRRAGALPPNVYLSGEWSYYVSQNVSDLTRHRHGGSRSDNDILLTDILDLKSQILTETHIYIDDKVKVVSGNIDYIFYEGLIKGVNFLQLPGQKITSKTIELGKNSPLPESITQQELYNYYFELTKQWALQNPRQVAQLLKYKGKTIVGNEYNPFNLSRAIADLLNNSCFVFHEGQRYLVCCDKVFNNNYEQVPAEPEVLRKAAVLNRLLIPLLTNNETLYVAIKPDTTLPFLPKILTSDLFVFNEDLKVVPQDSISKGVALLIRHLTDRVLPVLIPKQVTVETQLSPNNHRVLLTVISKIYNENGHINIIGDSGTGFTALNKAIYDVTHERDAELRNVSLVDKIRTVAYTSPLNSSVSSLRENIPDSFRLDILLGLKFDAKTGLKKYEINIMAPILNYDVIVIEDWDALTDQEKNLINLYLQIKPNLRLIRESKSKVTDLNDSISLKPSKPAPIVELTFDDILSSLESNLNLPTLQDAVNIKIITDDPIKMNQLVRSSLKLTDVKIGEPIRFAANINQIKAGVDYIVTDINREAVKLPKFKAPPFAELNTADLSNWELDRVTLVDANNPNDLISVYLFDSNKDDIPPLVLNAILGSFSLNGRSYKEELLAAAERNDELMYLDVLSDLKAFTSTVVLNFNVNNASLIDRQMLWEFGYALTKELLRGANYNYLVVTDVNDVDEIKHKANKAVLVLSTKSDKIPIEFKSDKSASIVIVDSIFDEQNIKQLSMTAKKFVPYAENDIDLSKKIILHTEEAYRALPQIMDSQFKNGTLDGKSTLFLIDLAVYAYAKKHKLSIDDSRVVRYMGTLIDSYIPNINSDPYYKNIHTLLDRIGEQFLNFHNQLLDRGFTIKNYNIFEFELLRKPNGHFDIAKMLSNLDFTLDLDELIDDIVWNNFTPIESHDVKLAELICSNITGIDEGDIAGLADYDHFKNKISSLFDQSPERYLSPNVLTPGLLRSINGTELFIRTRHGGYSIMLVPDLTNPELKKLGVVQLNINKKGRHKLYGYKLPLSKYEIRKRTSKSKFANFLTICIQYDQFNLSRVLADIENILSNDNNIDSILPSFNPHFDFNTALQLLQISIKNSYIDGHKQRLRNILRDSKTTGAITNAIILMTEETKNDYIKELANNYYISYLLARLVISTRLPSQGLSSILAGLITSFVKSKINDAYVNRWQFWLQGSDLDKILFK